MTNNTPFTIFKISVFLGVFILSSFLLIVGTTDELFEKQEYKESFYENTKQVNNNYDNNQNNEPVSEDELLKREIVKNIIEAFKTRNPKVISNIIEFPLKREYPLPYLKKEDFIKRFNEFFDKATIDKISNSTFEDWGNGGWRGVHFNGFTVNYEGKIYFFPLTKNEENYKKELINREKELVHFSIRDYKRPVHRIKTKNFLIRIDELYNETYRYTAWEEGKIDSDQPDLVLTGKDDTLMKYQDELTFTNGIYKHIVSIIYIGGEEEDFYVHRIEKNGKEVLYETFDFLESFVFSAPKNTDATYSEYSYYTVKEKRAYFYNDSNFSTQRSAYLVKDEVVYVQKVNNGFGYVEFTNAKGTASKGWVSLNDITPCPDCYENKLSSSKPSEIDEKARPYEGMQKFQDNFMSKFNLPSVPRNTAEITVKVNFTVKEDGSFSNIYIQGEDLYDMNDEIISVFEKMPNWKPAMKNGKAVQSSFTMPLKIRL